MDYYKKMRMNDKKFMPKVLSLEGKCYSKCISLPIKDVNSNVSAILKVLQNKGYKQIFIVDYTMPELMIPVIQAFIPGMLLNNSRM